MRNFTNSIWDSIHIPVLLAAVYFLTLGFLMLNAKTEAVYTCDAVHTVNPLFPDIDIAAPEWCEKAAHATAGNNE